jgi:hypothetical protein
MGIESRFRGYGSDPGIPEAPVFRVAADYVGPRPVRIKHPERVASGPPGGIFGAMAKPRVTFKLSRVAEGDWQIEAHYPGVEIRYIKGFKTKAEVDEWLQGTRRIDWLRSQGYAK